MRNKDSTKRLNLYFRIVSQPIIGKASKTTFNERKTL